MTSGLQVRLPNHSATLPPCFTIILCNFFPKEHLFVNIVGQNETRASYASKTGFLSKFTFPYYGEITVRNYLILAAFMRMSRTMDNAAKFERVEQIISEVCRGLGKIKSVYEAIYILKFSLKFKHSDSIDHTFIECQFTKSFTQEVLQWFNVNNSSNFILNAEDVLFGLSSASDTLTKKLNYTLLFLRYYVYKCKLQNNSPPLQVVDFINKIKYKYKIEKIT